MVKAFNHIQAAQIVSAALGGGHRHRRALAIAGDDEAAKQRVAAFIDALGFDVVDLGTLADSWRIEPGTPATARRTTPTSCAAHLAAATRG